MAKHWGPFYWPEPRFSIDEAVTFKRGRVNVEGRIVEDRGVWGDPVRHFYGVRVGTGWRGGEIVEVAEEKLNHRVEARLFKPQRYAKRPKRRLFPKCPIPRFMEGDIVLFPFGGRGRYGVIIEVCLPLGKPPIPYYSVDGMIDEWNNHISMYSEDQLEMKEPAKIWT